MIRRIAIAAAITMLTAAAGAAQGPALLRPLSEADFNATRESGCQYTFVARRSTYVYAIGHDFMIRTAAGRRTCPLTDAQFGALGEGGTRSCGGVRVTVRPTGRVTPYPEADSASGPATLTVASGRRSWSVRGQWGSAC